MKLIRIEFSQASRFIEFWSERGGVYWPDAITALKARYGFLDVPKDISELDAAKGVSFREGKFQSGDNSVAIELLRFYPAGILAQSVATVEHTESFLSDLIDFASSKFSLQANSKFENNLVESHIVVESKVNLDTLLSVQSTILDFINSNIQSRGFPNRFVTTGFEISCDSVAYPRPVLSSFTLQRRSNEPFERNLYYSQAPLTTAAHLSLLKEIEKLSK